MGLGPVAVEGKKLGGDGVGVSGDVSEQGVAY